MERLIRANQTTEEACYQLLADLGVPYTRVAHSPAGTIEQCKKVETALGARICKNLLLTTRNCSAYVLLLLPGNKPFITGEVSKILGTSRLCFAGEAELRELLGVGPGAASLLGLMHDRDRKVRLVIDRQVAGQEFIGCHPCVNTASLRIAMTDVFGKILPALGHSAQIIAL